MVIKILKKLLQYPTITPKDHNIYEYIQELLPDFKALMSQKNEVKNIFLYKIPKGYGEKEAFVMLPHCCFAGHIDVVPPGGDAEIPKTFLESLNSTQHNITKGKWEYPPFVPIIDNGYLYGRGSQDMKGGIACFLDALSKFIQTNQQNIIFSILLTSDEEGDGIYGTNYMLKILQDNNMLPSFAIVAEPTSDVIAGDTIKIGRRGSINGTITIKGVQGHVAYPQKCVNPVELLGANLGKLAGYNLDEGDSYFEPSKIVITDIRGGIETTNVTPDNLRIMFNVRNSTLTTLEDIRHYVDSILHTIPYTMVLHQSSKSFITQDSDLIDMLSQSVQQEIQVTPKLSTSGGTSDARFFSEYGIKVVEIGVCNDRIHAINERVSLRDIESLSKIFLQFLYRCNDLQKIL